MEDRTIVLATRNAGKAREMQALLAHLHIRLVPADAYPGAPEVDEDLPTLEGNARKKALALYHHTGRPSLADDTGLEVAALGGRPGVHSARFAGPGATDADNRMVLLQALEGRTDRSARFRTVIAFATGPEEVALYEGSCPGVILEQERGEGGFGYDALFVPDGDTRTFAEMPAADKNAVSHRARALRRLAEALAESYGAA